MTNYFNQKYNIITFYEYYKNIKTYQFSELIEIEGTDYINAIKEDFRKEFSNYLLINDIHLDSNDESILKNFKNSFDYLIVDNENIEAFHELYNISTWHILDFIYYLDMPDKQKFNFVYTAIRYVNSNLIIKIRRDLRDLEKYPIILEELEDQLMLTEGYNYDNLFK